MWILSNACPSVKDFTMDSVISFTRDWIGIDVSTACSIAVIVKNDAAKIQKIIMLYG
jgi:hypothetical protein